MASDDNNNLLSISTIVSVAGIIIAYLTYKNDLQKTESDLFRQKTEYARFLAERKIKINDQAKNTTHYCPEITNNTDESISVSVHYQDLDGLWVTEGWYRIEPNKSRTVPSTINSTIYIYADSDKREWNGENVKESVSRKVHKHDAFEYVDGFPILEDEGCKTVKFYKTKLAKTYYNSYYCIAQLSID